MMKNFGFGLLLSLAVLACSSGSGDTDAGTDSGTDVDAQDAGSDAGCGTIPPGNLNACLHRNRTDR